jgi:hypothetical protein
MINLEQDDLRSDITELPAQDPPLDENGNPKLRLGWVVYEELGDVAHVMGRWIKLSTGEELNDEEFKDFVDGTYYQKHPNPSYIKS